MYNQMNYRRNRRKKSKTYYVGMMVLFIFAAMYMIAYPYIVKDETEPKEESTSVVETSYEPAQNSAQVLTGEDDTETQNATQAAISAIEEKEKATYNFKYPDRLTSHFEKHGAEMGFKTEEEYLEAANALISNPEALHKTEAEDGDDIYYLESTDEIAFVSTEGFIRTYFICSGKDYYDRQ